MRNKIVNFIIIGLIVGLCAGFLNITTIGPVYADGDDAETTESVTDFDITLEAPTVQAGDDFANKAINNVFLWSGVAAVIAIIYGGITYAVSSGNSEKIKQAKNIIIYAIIGLVLIITSFTIVNFVLEAING